MMLAWTFAATMIDEVASLIRAMGKHRYVRETDLRIHWAVDEALADLPGFKESAEAFGRKTIERGSRDPGCWRAATAEEIIAVLTAFWSPSDESTARKERLIAALSREGLPIAEHEPWESDDELPPFPELLLLDWTFFAVEDLDTERHAGVLAALEDRGEEVHPSEPVFVEFPAFSVVELCDGAPMGILPADVVLWADGPFAYVDYVFRGVSRAAKLQEPPISPEPDVDG